MLAFLFTSMIFLFSVFSHTLTVPQFLSFTAEILLCQQISVSHTTIIILTLDPELNVKKVETLLLFQTNTYLHLMQKLTCAIMHERIKKSD